MVYHTWSSLPTRLQAVLSHCQQLRLTHWIELIHISRFIELVLTGSDKDLHAVTSRRKWPCKHYTLTHYYQTENDDSSWVELEDWFTDYSFVPSHQPALFPFQKSPLHILRFGLSQSHLQSRLKDHGQNMRRGRANGTKRAFSKWQVFKRKDLDWDCWYPNVHFILVLDSFCITLRQNCGGCPSVQSESFVNLAMQYTIPQAKMFKWWI